MFNITYISSDCYFVSSVSCADMMRGHLREMDYKEIKLDDHIYMYPSSMEEDIRQHHAKGETNKKSLPQTKH